MLGDVAPPSTQPPARPRRGRAYAGAVLAVAVATAVGVVTERLPPRQLPAADLSNLVLVYLLAVVWTAGRLGLWPSVVASCLGVGAFDFFFVPPVFSLAGADPHSLVTLAALLAVAAVTSTLTDRVRAEADGARRQARRTAALLGLSRALADTRDGPAVAAAVVGHAADVFAGTAVLLVPGAAGDGAADHVLSTAAAAGPPPWDLGAAERSAAAAAARNNTAATTVAAAFLPLAGPAGAVGVLGVRAAGIHEADPAGLLEAFASQAGAALDRARLAEEARAAWERVEAEFLRNTLLSSVSHDLRTPLAAIAGAADAMLQPGPPLPASVRRDLTETVLDEARRMERLVNNLLDVTRLESGGLTLRREWHPVGELVGAALHRTRGRLGGRAVGVSVPAELPMVRVDAVSFEQVLVNLLDNAAEHTAAGTPVDVWAEASGGRLAMTVADRGPGVPAGTHEQVFRKFFRSHGPAGGRRGVGLGLAICRGIVEAHGGTIAVADRPGGGAAFRVELPAESPPVGEGANAFEM